VGHVFVRVRSPGENHIIIDCGGEFGCPQLRWSRRDLCGRRKDPSGHCGLNRWKTALRAVYLRRDEALLEMTTEKGAR
jgi:hypothetical protein